MEQLEKYEKLMETVSYKCYSHFGETVKISIDEENNPPRFVIDNSDISGKMNDSQRKNIETLLKEAMNEVLKCDRGNKNISEFLGW